MQEGFGGNNTGALEVSTTLNAKGVAGRMDFERETLIAFNLRGREGGAQAELTDVASLRSASGGSSRSYIGVRRLTPLECERLQGFPAQYTAVENRGKPAADGPRYKAIGNSMAVPCVGWILSRIVAQLENNG